LLEVDLSDCVTEEEEVVGDAREIDVVTVDDDEGNSNTEEKPLQIGIMKSKFVRKPFQQHRKKRYDIYFVDTIVIFVDL